MKSKNMSKILMDNILYICLLLMIVIIAIISPSFISVRVLSDVSVSYTHLPLISKGIPLADILFAKASAKEPENFGA